MTDRLLYNLAVPETAQADQRQQQAQQLLSEGILGSGPAAVEAISADAGSRTLVGQVSGPLAPLTADEFEELFGAGGIEVVPYFQRGPDTGSEDGYYALENVDVKPEHPADERIQRFDGSLERRGSRRSHRRSLLTNPTTEDNPFGSASTEEIGIPARASKVQWYNSADGSLEAATVQRTESGEHDDVDVYDATEPSFSAPTLVYDVAYRHEWPVDVRVWDTYGRSKYRESVVDSTTVGTASVNSSMVSETREAVQWQRVFTSDHDYRSTPVLENDLLRLEFDEPGQKLRAYRWDDAEELYDRVQLGQSSWRLFDLDITRIGVERIDGQAEFEDTSNPGTTHNLNFSLKRGYTDALWLNPDNEGSIPGGLKTRLDPIAHDSDQDPAAIADVIERTELDR